MSDLARTHRPEGIDDAFVDGALVDDLAEPGPAEPGPAHPAEPHPANRAAEPNRAAPATGPRLGVRGWLRWTWRQLTSMRVALMLLMLLAVGAVPGSVLPQRPQNPAKVLEYLGDHPRAGAWLDRAGFFDVYASPWFAAIDLLLFISLIGCIIPRTAAHLRALRARPPRVPRRFSRFPVHETVTTDATPAQVIEAAGARLRGRWPLPRFRVQVHDGALSAERGYLRETGNLVFHTALIGLLVAVACGQMFHFKGQAIVVEGRGFANAVVDYDTFERGSLFQASSLRPFSLRLDSFDARYSTDADSFAQSRDFTAHVTVTDPGAGAGRPATIKVNDPLIVDGAKIYLQGNGYAPQVTVRDAEGRVAYSGSVPFLPQDQVYTSRGVIKVPDVSPGLDQIGLVGYLLPTAEVTGDGARSMFPQPLNPLLVLDVYHGDLGLDDGSPQNVYRLDTSRMREVTGDDGRADQVMIAPGQSVDLPGGLGTITFDALPRYVALDLRHDPSLPWVLTFALVALAGLGLSLFTPRRRVWVRARALDGGGPVGDGGGPAGGRGGDDGGDRDDGGANGGEDRPAGRRTVVEVAALARGDDAGLAGEVLAVVESLPGNVERPAAERAGVERPRTELAVREADGPPTTRAGDGPAGRA